jgi:hypothetical protein
MAINRKDIPLASTSDPVIDPSVKRTVTVNPNGTKTYKMSWERSETKKVPAKSSSSKTPVKSSSSKTPAKSGSSLRRTTPPSEAKKSTYNEIEYSTLPEVKTKGVIEKKPEIKTKADASALTSRGDNRTWQERRKAEVTKRDYNRYKQGDETISEWKERSKKASEEIAKKNYRKEKNNIGSSLGTGYGGGCSRC